MGRFNRGGGDIRSDGRPPGPARSALIAAGAAIAVLAVAACGVAAIGQISKAPDGHPGAPAAIGSRAVTHGTGVLLGTASLPVPPSGWTVTAKRIRQGSYDRYYLLARPRDVTAPHLPVLIVLHGRNMTPAAIERSTGFLGVVGQAIVVYPAGVDESWNAGYCCGEAHARSVNDVAFIETVVASVLKAEPGTSARQVYLVGYSNGGRMAYRLACADPGAFAGIAAVEAVAVSSCHRASPVPLIEVASDGDPLLTIGPGGAPKDIAGQVEPTVSALVQQWRALEKCQAPSTSAAQGHLTTTEWSHCSGPGRVETADYSGGSHAWPQGRPGTPPAQQVIWSFFRGSSTSRPAGQRGDTATSSVVR